MRHMNTLQILKIAIDAEGGDENAGASRLAELLDCTPQAIYNWKRKGSVPHMAERALKLMYSKQITKAIKAEKAAAKDCKQ